MNPSELENIINLPAIREAIRAKQEAEEAKALSDRLACLDSLKATSDELTSLKGKAAQLDEQQAVLDRQRDELSKQRAAFDMAIQAVGASYTNTVRDLNKQHGGAMVSAITMQLANRCAALQREIEYKRSLRKRVLHWTGETIEKPDPEAMAHADELERKAKATEQARTAIEALQYARISPQQIERDIKQALRGTGFELVTHEQKQEGWRLEGWRVLPGLPDRG